MIYSGTLGWGAGRQRVCEATLGSRSGRQAVGLLDPHVEVTVMGDVELVCPSWPGRGDTFPGSDRDQAEDRRSDSGRREGREPVGEPRGQAAVGRLVFWSDTITVT